ncbi:MAG TPA: ABC transporter substrate-binding protein [Candidatus Dormibacteraeota bacterium]|nr:ABC transporter substrate-binding protein [Candidatus Dormibacteraeota bacterium]
MHLQKNRAVGIVEPVSACISAALPRLFWLLAIALGSSFGCSHPARFNPEAVTFLIETMPTNLDPRIGTDAQSQRISGLIFSALVERDAQMNPRGDLAESWEFPDPLTYIFHLRHGVYFHNRRPLTSGDVKYTFDTMLAGPLKTPKRGGFRMVASIEAPDDFTVIFHLKEPYASFLWNLSRPGVGIVPRGSPADFAGAPVGTGPFRFVGSRQDDYVILERNVDYFRGAPLLTRVKFRIVPEATVRALELRKGTADIELTSLSPDMVPVLAREPHLDVTEQPGTIFGYIGINLEDPLLSRREIRQALAYATDRETIIRYLWRGQAQLANGLLPPNHWAYERDLPQYDYNPALAETLLDRAGYVRTGKGHSRFKLTLKTSTEELSRLTAAALQDQWRRVGIELELRPLEFATLLSDASRGDFQLCYLRWVGANNDPDIFEYVFHSRKIPPNGANRGHYRNSRLDVLLDAMRVETNRANRIRLCSEVQKIIAEDLPYLPLWFTDNISVHRRELGPVDLSPSNDYDFLAKIGWR